MLVRDLKSIMYDDERIAITVYANGFEIDWKTEISLERMVRDYGDYEILRMFSFVDCSDRSVVGIRVEKPKSQECEMERLCITGTAAARYRCKSCGYSNYELIMPNFCPTCGAEVVKR